MQEEQHRNGKKVMQTHFLAWSTEKNDVVNLNQATGGLDTEESRYCTRNELN